MKNRLLRIISGARLTPKNPIKHSPKSILQIQVEFSIGQRFGGKEFFVANIKKMRHEDSGRVSFLVINHPFDTVDLFCVWKEYQRAKKGLDFTVRGKINGRPFRCACARLKTVREKEKANSTNTLAVFA